MCMKIYILIDKEKTQTQTNDGNAISSSSLKCDCKRHQYTLNSFMHVYLMKEITPVLKQGKFN